MKGGNVNIIFDGPPSHESGRFVEIENDQGESVRFGEWKPHPKVTGWWMLQIPLGQIMLEAGRFWAVSLGCGGLLLGMLIGLLLP